MRTPTNVTNNDNLITMADVTITLIHQKDSLYYKTDRMKEYEKMGEDSTVGADPGQTIEWVCGDDSIAKINAITVNLEKQSGKNWKQFYKTTPEKIDSDGKYWSAVIKSDSVDPKNPEYNGYDISYTTSDGVEITVDPQVQIPQD